MRLGIALYITLIVLTAPVASAQVSSIESWSGTYSMTQTCNATSISSSGPMHAILVRGGGGDFIFLSFSDMALILEDCEISSREPVATGGAATISGNTITANLDDEEPFNFSATIDGAMMSGSFGDDEVSGSFTAQKSSTGIGPMTGDYSGTYTIGAACDDGGRTESTGTLTFSMFHTGERFGGFATIDLIVIDTAACQSAPILPLTFATAGMTSGSLLDGYILFPSFVSFSGSSSGSTISGNVSSLLLADGSMASGTFSVTRSGGGLIPTINPFAASPSTISRGESATLIWSTSNAISVSIDQGVGSQPTSGSTVVSPSSTTTYTLTATGTGGTSTAQVTVEVITTPEVALVSLPDPLVQGTSAGGATTTFVLTNIGGESTSISLTRDGDFFTFSPEGFSLAPGERQIVTITGLQRETGSFLGRVLASGAGVPPELMIPIQLLSVPTPSGPTAAEPETSRVDVAAEQGTNPTGTAIFRNTGQATIQGTLVSTVPWLIPQAGLIEVEPGESVTVSFTIDRSLRPPNSDLGSLEGKLMLVFRTGPSGKRAVDPRNGAATTTSLVTVVDTSKPPVNPGAIPPLGPGEVALFIPGAGHVQGGSGLFFSDITLVNRSGSPRLDNVRMFYTPIGQDVQTLTTTVGGIASGSPMALADVVRTVFEAESTLGSLQIRAPNLSQLSVNANIILRTSGEDQQFYGNTIPALRSDRSVGPGESFFLTGLTRTGDNRTNLFIQETAGGEVTVDIEFYDAAGQKLGERNEIFVGPFRLVGLFFSPADPILPLGAVSAVITSRTTSSGRFSAYATPVDGESGDSWSLVDWNAQNSFVGSAAMLIPVAGAVLGANDLNFRTDVAVINRGESQASGILRYIPRLEEGRAPIDRTITIGPRQSAILEDVTRTLFEIDPLQATLGFMTFTPQSGELTVTSRNFASVGTQPGTFGTGVATLALDSSMRLGDIRRIGGVKDASLEAIQDGTPGSFRSNFAMMETTGAGTVTVRVTLHFTYSTGTLVSARGTASKEYTLQPNQFMQLGRISAEILGSSRDDFGDFDNLQAEFAVVAGDGAAAVYVSSVENDTGDSILRVE